MCDVLLILALLAYVMTGVYFLSFSCVLHLLRSAVETRRAGWMTAAVTVTLLVMSWPSRFLAQEAMW